MAICKITTSTQPIIVEMLNIGKITPMKCCPQIMNKIAKGKVLERGGLPRTTPNKNCSLTHTKVNKALLALHRGRYTCKKNTLISTKRRVAA